MANETENKERCQKKVWKGFVSHRCRYLVWKDGFCKKHHPDMYRAREELSRQRHIIKTQRSPENQLIEAKKEFQWEKEVANSRIQELESKIKELESRIEVYQNIFREKVK